MNLGENSSTEPKHLVGVPKTCPRSDCPNPIIGIVWKGSAKQLQYHCYGCWRKFNYGGILRSWAKQVSPPKWWLRQHAPNVKRAPKLLGLQPPWRSGPTPKRIRTLPSRRSVAQSSAKEDDIPNAVHAEPSQKRTTRANVNHVINKEGTTAIATSGEDHGTRIPGSSTLPLLDVVPKFNGVSHEEAPPGPGTRDRTSPISDNTRDMMNILDDLLGEDELLIPNRHCFMSPRAHVFWRNDEVDSAGIASLAANVDSNAVPQGTTGLTNAQSGGVTQPRRKAMTITFRNFSVPSRTFYY